MKVLSVFNQKGGVGKTTTTINLGAALALMMSHEVGASEEPGRVLIIDLDQQTHSEITLSGGFFGQRRQTGLGPYDNIAGLLMLDTTLPVTDIIRTAEIPVSARHNMDFIPSSKEKMPNVDSALKNDPVDGLFRLREILETLEPFYQYVVIDNPPGLSYLSINSLVGSTHVLIPCQLEAPSIESFSGALKTIQSVQRQHNRSLHLLGILPTMCDFRQQEQHEFLAFAQQRIQESHFETHQPACGCKLRQQRGAGYFQLQTVPQIKRNGERQPGDSGIRPGGGGNPPVEWAEKAYPRVHFFEGDLPCRNEPIKTSASLLRPEKHRSPACSSQ